MASGVDARLMRATKFPPEFSQKVDTQKVNLDIMKTWIATRIPELLGKEDDVVTELCVDFIESSRYPDIKAIQIQLTGFLDKDTPQFCKTLWNLLLSAQSNPSGVPKELLEAKKLELIQEKIDADRAAEESRKHRVEPDRRDRDTGDMRDRDRRDRGRGRGDGRFGRRGDRGDRAFESRGRGNFQRAGNRSRSPEPQRDARMTTRGDSFGRDRDRYVPRGRGNRGDRRGGRRERSRSYSASSRADSRSSSGSRSSARPRSRDGQASKRLRSPAHDTYRPGRSDRSERDERPARPRRSRSASSERRSPAPKRRRHSPSRSRSPERRRRRSSVSSARSRSRSHGRTSSRSAPRRSFEDRPRHRRRSPSISDDGNGRGDRARDNQRRSRKPEGRRRNSSSEPSVLSVSPEPEGDVYEQTELV